MENKSQYNEKWSRALVCSFSLPRARFPAKAYRARLFVIVILEGSPKKKSSGKKSRRKNRRNKRSEKN